MEEKSVKEIEMITGMPSGTVRSHLSRGRRELFEKNIHVTELINRHTILTNIDKTSTLIETLNQDEKEEIIETLDVIKKRSDHH